MNYPELENLISVIRKLRDPVSGCPWDLKQDHQSLLKYLIEESYEFKHAVELEEDEAMEEELGDVLLQVLLHSQIASEQKRFDIESVSRVLAKKMIHRHPHVFKNPTIKLSADEVSQNWKEIKKNDKKEKEYFFTEKDFNLPSLIAAQKIGARSNEVGFDWDNYKQVMLKVDEELLEVKDELTENMNKDKVEEELGDLLFSVVQLARHLKINADDALRSANIKFVKRFNKVEDYAKKYDKDLSKSSVEELEDIWSKVKKGQA